MSGTKHLPLVVGLETELLLPIVVDVGLAHRLADGLVHLRLLLVVLFLLAKFFVDGKFVGSSPGLSGSSFVLLGMSLLISFGAQ